MATQQPGRSRLPRKRRQPATAQPYTVGAEGDYTFVRTVSEMEIIELAAHIVENRYLRRDALVSPDHTRRYLGVLLGHLEQEVFGCIFLDNRHRVISFEKLFYGTIDGASVHPREVVKRSLALNAAALIAVHNHPSGVAEPSRADEAITERLRTALAIVDVRLLDHIVVGATETTSFAERGLL